MSMRLVEADDACSAVSDAVSQAYSCPPVPLRRRTRLKKTAPAPPSKVTTPLSSASHSNGGLSLDSMPAIGVGHVGDDCAINELLEGRMELDVVLPDSRQVRMTVERRTAMMDLLVQVTTANKINPGGHVIHILTDRGKDFLHYKPNTPIGSLDTNTVYIVPKSSIIDPPIKKMPKVANKPFEQTFRLQVNLPRGQLMVLRVSPRTTLAEVKQMACSEKNLDYSRYQLVDTRCPNQILDLNSRMEDYGSTEISLMSNSSINANIRNSTTDLIAYSARDDDKKKKGILGLFSRKKSKGSTADSSSDSMDSRGVSPSRGEEIRRISAKTGSKKRPAPPPPPPPPIVRPVATEKTPPKLSAEPIEGTTVSHSRHSSDSSGYHEASVLSDSPENPPPDMGGRTNQDHTRKTSTPTKPTQPKPILSKVSSYSENALWSTSSKKRKAPPPPPSRHSNPPVRSTEPAGPQMAAAGSSLSIEEIALVEEVAEVSNPSTSTSTSPASSPQLSIEEGSGVVVGWSKEGSSSKSNSPAHSSSPQPSIEEEPVVPFSPLPDTPPTSRPASPVLDSGIVLEDSDSLTDEVSLHPEETDGTLPLDRGETLGLSEEWPEFNLEEPLGFTNPALSTMYNIPTGTRAAPGTYWQASNPVHAPPSLKKLTNKIKDFAFSTPGSGGPARTSHTSLNTIDDIENDFEQMIAEAQKSLDESEEPPHMDKQQMLSHIEATFSAVEDTKEPITPVVEQDDLGWVYTIPDPPPAFRNDEANNVVAEETRDRSSSDGSTASSYKTPPPLPGSPPPAVTIPVAEPSSSSDTEDQNVAIVSREFVAPKPRRPLLQNFTFGTYTAPKEDILQVLCNESPKAETAPYSQVQVASDKRNQYARSKSVPVPVEPPVDERLLGGLEGSVRGFKGQVKQRCEEMRGSSLASPALVGRCMSMMDVNRKVVIEELPRKVVQRSTSGLEQNHRKAQSVQNLNRHEEEPADERLDEEYSQLHRQFLDWNRKLQDNQNLLEKQRIVPSEIAKSQTLPRPPKTKFTEVEESVKPISTLERPKSQVLANVTIGSWQQRKSTENLSTIPPPPLRPKPEVDARGDNRVANKPRPVSMYAAPYRNAITAQVIASQAQAKPKIDIQFSNYEAKTSSALRTSSQKTEFRPPEVRSTNSRQRFPPSAKDEPKRPVDAQATKVVVVAAAKVNGTETPPVAKEQAKSVVSSGFKEPPPLPQVPIVSQQPVLKKSVNKRQFRTLPPKLEPREELMLEIRNFGGRQALRKIPVSQINWQLKVYGNSSVNA